MSDEQPPLTEEQLAELWAEIGREAAMAEAMNESLADKIRRYDYERERASRTNVREFRPRPSSQQPPPPEGPREHGNGGHDPAST